MEQSRSSQLLLELKRYGAVAGAALLTAAVPFNVSAHVHDDNPVSRSLKGYEGFVNQMHQMNADGSVGGTSCCHLQDGVGNLKEEIVKEDGKPVYYVTFTHNTDGKPLERPVRIRVPPEKVLTDRFAIQYCKELKKEVASGQITGTYSDEQKAQKIKDAETCNRPPTNISWISGVYKDNSTGEYSVPAFYCYIPKPKNQ